MRILECTALRDEIEEEIKEQISRIDTDRHHLPSLCVVMVGDNPASESYVRNKRKACERVGIKFTLQKFESDVPQKYIEDFVRDANYHYDGVMVQLPLPVGYDTDAIISCINPAKDVDGLTKANKMCLYSDSSNCYIPCTARGVIELIEDSITEDLSGLNICVVGRSDLVGRPIAHELEKRNATVTLCHSKTVSRHNEWKPILENSDIVISAVGVPNIFKNEYSLEPIAYIDCGYSFVDGKPCGDIDTNYLEDNKYLGYVTTTPRGTGVLTVTALLENVMDAWKKTSSPRY